MEGRNPILLAYSYLKFNYSIEKFACDFALQDKFLCKWKQMKKIILSINDVMSCIVSSLSIVPYSM